MKNNSKKIRFVQKKKFKMTKAKALVSGGISLGVVGAIVLTTVLGANAANSYYSLEYIEELKSKYSNGTLNILEIAPSGDDSTFGYLVEGSEPTYNWESVAAMFNDKDARREYAEGVFTDLKANGFASESNVSDNSFADEAPLAIKETYQEWLPTDIKYADSAFQWDSTNNRYIFTDGSVAYKTMTLDMKESDTVKGEMVQTTNGIYSAKSDYIIKSVNYESDFSFDAFKDAFKKLTKTTKSKTIKSGSTKIFGYNSTTESIAVFGATQANWNDATGYSCYDMTSVYKTSGSYRYYTIEVEAGKTYSLNFEALATKGKGQVMIYGLDSSYKAIYFTPNYSKQNYLWSDYFTTGTEYSTKTYDFNIPAGSPTKYIQIRFDVSDIETMLKVRNIQLREYKDGDEKGDVYAIANVATDTNVTFDDTNKVVSVTAAKGTNTTTAGTSYYIPVASNQIYRLTYHVEVKGDGKSNVNVYAYGSIDGSKLNEGKPVATLSKTASGTYTTVVDCSQISGVSYLVVELGATSTADYPEKCSYSMISLTKKDAYKVKASNGDYVQDVDHYYVTNDATSLGTDNLFNYTKWYESGSNDIYNSNNHGFVKSSSTGVIELSSSNAKTNNVSTKYSTAEYVQSDRLYYMSATANNKYQVKFRPANYQATDESGRATETDDVRCLITFYDENRNYIDNADVVIIATEGEITGSKSDANKVQLVNGYCTADFTADSNAAYMQISFATTKKEQHSNVDYIGIFEYDTPEAYWYNLSFTPVTKADLDAGTVSKYVIAGKICEDTAGTLQYLDVGTSSYPDREYYYLKDGKYTLIGGKEETDEYLKDKKGTVGGFLYRGVSLYTAECSEDNKITVTDNGKDLDANIKYYVLDEANDRYLEATDAQKKKNGTVLYIPTGYSWAGNYDEGDFYFDLDQTYYTAEINNSSSYVQATDTNTNDSTTLYTKSGDNYTIAGTKSTIVSKLKDGKTFADVASQYYITIDPVVYYRDENHIYCAYKREFHTPWQSEYAPFTRSDTYYEYVGTDANGNGLGNFNYDPSVTSKSVKIVTSTVFYQGELINNQWLKRYVLDYNRYTTDPFYNVNNPTYVTDYAKTIAALESSCDVKVTTFTTSYLNTFTTEAELNELRQTIESFEMVVIDDGSGKGNFVYDLNGDIEALLEDEILRNGETKTERDSDDKYIPVVFDVNLLKTVNKSKYPNLTKLFDAICEGGYERTEGGKSTNIITKTTGGVDDYIYRFDSNDLKDKSTVDKFISNTKVISDLKNTEGGNNLDYTNPQNEYYDVWQNLTYENSLRQIRKKYTLFNEDISEADCIRHILNFKGQRAINKKPTIKILEIQPNSDESQLYWWDNTDKIYICGSKKVTERQLNQTLYVNDDTTSTEIPKIDVDVWFMGPDYDKDIDGNQTKNRDVLMYTDENGELQQTRFEITTMAAAELNGKVDDLAELYDMVYIGSSYANLGKSDVTSLKKITDENRPDYGDIVPDYDSDDIDELFYVSMGDTYTTHASGLSRSPVSGLVKDDYKTVGNLWYVDSSDCTLRGNGNDLTETKMEELQVFIEQGLPVVVSDSLTLQDFYADLSVMASAKTYYQREGREVYIPGHEGDENYCYSADGNETHVLMTAQVQGSIPKGVKTNFVWYSTTLNEDGEPNGYVDVDGNLVGDVLEVDYQTEVYGNFLRRLFKWSKETFDNYGAIDTDGDGIEDFSYLDIIPNAESSNKTIKDNRYYFCRVEFDFTGAKNNQGTTLKYNGLYGNTTKVLPLESDYIFVKPESRRYDLQYFDSVEDNTSIYNTYSSQIITEASSKGINTNSFNRFYCVKVTPNPEEVNDYILYIYKFKKKNSSISFNRETRFDKYICDHADYSTASWDEDGNTKPCVVSGDGYQIGVIAAKSMTNSRGFCTFMNVDFTSSLFSGENEDKNTRRSVGHDGGTPNFTSGLHYNTSNHTNYVLKYGKVSGTEYHQGYRLSFYAPTTNAKGEIEYVESYDAYGNATGRNGLPRAYTLVTNADGYDHSTLRDVVSLTSANEAVGTFGDSNKIEPGEGGYSLTGYKADGVTPITGGVLQLRKTATTLDNRMDTSSNIYDVISYGFDNFSNVFTQNELERANQNIEYREMFIKYVNLSEPVIETDVEGQTQAQYEAKLYPNGTMTSNETFEIKFKITNSTEVDTITTRYSYEFYVDENGDGQYVDSERQDSVSIYPYDKKGLQTSSDANGEHVYTLRTKMAETSSPLKPWKLVVKKIGDEGAHTSISGYVYVKPNTPSIINAIQVLPGDWDPDYVDLHNMPSGYNYGKTEKNSSTITTIYEANKYKGSLFLGDVYADLVSESQKEGVRLERTIFYCQESNSDLGRYNYSNGIPTSMRIDDGYETTGSTGKFVYNAAQPVHHVQFKVGKTVGSEGGYDYILNIYFTNICDLNASYTTSSDSGLLDGFNMIIMGFGDDYNHLTLGKTYSSIDVNETLGYNQNATLAIEKLIDEGQPVLFCHDSTSYNVNFINYIANDVLGWINSAANTVTNWWNKLKDDVTSFFTGEDYSEETDYSKYDSQVHSSRLKQGYYTNLILREPLGMDAYGITYKIKERADYSYNDSGLKAGHSFNSLYSEEMESTGFLGLGSTNGGSQSVVVETDTAFNGNKASFRYRASDEDDYTYYDYNYGKRLYRSLSTTEKETFLRQNEGYCDVAVECLTMEDNGFKISWAPTKLTWDGSQFTDGSEQGKVSTNVFAQGFTSYVAHRFDGGDSGISKTDRVTQVNKGKITTYPYNINLDEQSSYNTKKSLYKTTDKDAPTSDKSLYNTTATIYETHEQYFQVNLNKNQNDEIATVWYCLAESDSNSAYSGNYSTLRNDCENGYYVYTKGNCTYTGAGHTNEFSTFEAKLFLNTIIASDRSDVTVPKADFYDATGLHTEDYLVLTHEEGTYSVEIDGAYINSDNTELIWDQDIHFKVNNTNSSVTNLTNRTVRFYTLDANENEQNITDIAYVYETTDTGAEGERQTCNANGEFTAILPGVTYGFKVPDSILEQLANNYKGSGTGEATITIYIHVELTDEEKETSTTSSDKDYSSAQEMYYFYYAQTDANGYYIYEDAEGNRVQMNADGKYVLKDGTQVEPKDIGTHNLNKIYTKLYYRDEPVYYTKEVDGVTKYTDANGNVLEDQTQKVLKKDADGKQVYETKYYTLAETNKYVAYLLNGDAVELNAAEYLAGNYVDTAGNTHTLFANTSDITPNSSATVYTKKGIAKYKAVKRNVDYEYLVKSGDVYKEYELDYDKATGHVTATTDSNGQTSYYVSTDGLVDTGRTHSGTDIWYIDVMVIADESQGNMGLIPFTTYNGETPGEEQKAKDESLDISLNTLLNLS